MHHRLRAAITLVAAGAVLLAGTSTPGYASTIAEGATAPVSSRAAAAAGYDGEAIFTGLFLSHGPVADKFRELVAGGINLDPDAPETSPGVAELVTEITKAIQKRDPAFFDGFRRAVTSGDRVQVDQALRSAQEMLGTVLTEDLNATVAQLGYAQLGIVYHFFVVHEVALVLHVVVHIREIIVYAKADSVAVIDHERWVNEVATAFATA